ncbi:MAG: MFS transporter [Methanoregula sp.]
MSSAIPEKMDRLHPETGAETETPEICHTPPNPVTRTGKIIVLFIAVLTGFITPFDASAMNIALPSIGGEFHMDAIALMWIVTAYLLAAALFSVPFGKIADIYGRKRIFLYGIAVFSFASLATTMAPTSGALIALRVVQGLGAAMIFGTAMAILTSVFPPGERGKTMGIYLTAVYFGLSVGPCLGGFMTQYLGWRSIFFVNVPIGIAITLLVLWKLEGEWAECHTEKFDLTGSIIYGAAIVAVMYGLSILPNSIGMILILAGIVGGIVFALYEMRIPFPVLDIKLLTGNRAFAFSNLAALISYSATWAVTFLLSLDLQYTKGFSPEYAGIIIIAQTVVQTLFTPIAGKLSDRIEPRIVASAGMALTTFGLFLLIFITEATTVWYLIVSLLVLGAGLGLFATPNTITIMNSVEKRFYGVASGIVGTIRLFGQMISMGIAMMIFAIIIGPVEITPAYYPQFITSMHIGFIFFTVLCIVGIFFSLKGKARDSVASAVGMQIHPK